MALKEAEEQQSLRRKSDDEVTFDPFLRVPSEKPPFSLAQLKQVIPPHCFERSIIRPFSYLIYDLLINVFLFYAAITVIPTLASPFHFIAWPAYWVPQGYIFGSLWIIAHECGHHAFSDFPLIDNVVGFVLHSFLLVPFFSFKYSHRRHHSNNGSRERDLGWSTRLRSSKFWFLPFLKNPLGRMIAIFLTLMIGWLMYLLFNFHSRPYKRFASHFDPYSPIYNDSERAQVFVSNAGILVVLYLLYRMSTTFSISWVIRIYGVPFLITNAGLVIVIYLHHIHPALPHYDSSEWDWFRGTLCTVDRDYGFINRVLHNIADTHVVHHLFSTIPHYHAKEATKAIRPVLGDYYLFDKTPVLKALWREVRECVFIEPDYDKGKVDGVYWCRKDL